ncbi:MAG: hypothetical protein AB1610_11620 [Nitrospirota bacterium]
MRVLNNEKGEGFIKFLFFALVIGFTVYVGIKFAMPYYRYSAFKSYTEELVRISVWDSEKTKAQLFEKAQEIKLPFERENLYVTKEDKLTRAQVSWSETVDIFGFYQKELYFSIDEEG